MQETTSPSLRIGGVAGLLFAAGVMLQNGVFLNGNPLPSAPLPEIEAFYMERSSSIAAAVGWVAFNIPLLLAFGAAVSCALERNPAARLYARIGFGGVVLLAANFSCTTWIQAVLASDAAALAASGHLKLVWALHTAAFTSSAAALSVAMGAFSLGGWTEGLVPRWTASLGLVGSALLVLSGLMAVGTLSGGPGMFFQLGGFVAWLVFLLTASIRLLRR